MIGIENYQKFFTTGYEIQGINYFCCRPNQIHVAR